MLFVSLYGDFVLMYLFSSSVACTYITVPSDEICPICNTTTGGDSYASTSGSDQCNYRSDSLLEVPNLIIDCNVTTKYLNVGS
jgi:hypothetical protein